MDRLYGIAEEKVNSVHTNTKKELANKKAELIVLFEARQDLAEQLHIFKKEIERFSTLDIGEEVMKNVLQRLIQNIEVFEGG